MLAASWVWISQRSLQDPLAVERNEATEAAADAHSAYLPWLAWSAADVRKTTSSNDRLDVRPGDAENQLRGLVEEIFSEASLRFRTSEFVMWPTSGDLQRHRKTTQNLLGAENERFLADIAHIWPVRKSEDLSDALGRLGLPAQSFVHRAEEILQDLRSRESYDVPE